MKAVCIARCPEHGLHGERDECFVCGGPVEKVPMVPLMGLSLKEHIEEAHYHVRAAQDLAYRSDQRARLRVRLALNKAQSLLIRRLTSGDYEPKETK